MARTSSIKARTQAMNQLRSLVSTAPTELRERLRALPIKHPASAVGGHVIMLNLGCDLQERLICG